MDWKTLAAGIALPPGQLKMFPNVSYFPLQNENFTKQLSLQLMSV